MTDVLNHPHEWSKGIVENVEYKSKVLDEISLYPTKYQNAILQNGYEINQFVNFIPQGYAPSGAGAVNNIFDSSGWIFGYGLSKVFTEE